ncbi:hypothetical protein K450DRAFT_230745 [Umbelopsis ramanniana AG]|uniref:Uncharacterized protein n=1 Tax=Umbelopsis ramanniana AG TaxID=1314678 RepID=A0AAD5EE23_UMBRA|nr:uncharacterized protein K450DRAFT_230745 [Umbelopsis ramanniana AG]KAI8581692.1 hypothetical protein K450DRAFT_230745 [Umbelopsis ramanniana AG]
MGLLSLSYIKYSLSPLSRPLFLLRSILTQLISMAATTRHVPIMPQPHISSIQNIRNEGKVKNAYISEKLMARSNSIASNSSSNSAHSKPISPSLEYKASPRDNAPMFPSSKLSYGSIPGAAASDRQSVGSLVEDDQYTPPTPPHTTIAPNDNDEGIYLLWTQHMLRQKGFRPSSYNLNDDDSDSDSTNSSLTDDDVEDDRPLPTMPSYHTIPPSQEATPDIVAKEVNGWMVVPFCGFCFM